MMIDHKKTLAAHTLAVGSRCVSMAAGYTLTTDIELNIGTTFELGFETDLSNQCRISKWYLRASGCW